MRKLIVLIGIGTLATAGYVAAQSKQSKKGRTSPVGYSDTPMLPGQKWKVHDIERPRPPVVTPAPAGAPLPAPSDAIVLFDGKDLSKWQSSNKGKVGAPGWKVENGYVEVVGGSGDLVTRDKFGSGQYHIEWASPNPPDGTSQWRGNSGVLLMSRYEIQVLDSYNTPTYADGQAGAIYGQWPPHVNASRKPGEWQTFDIAFEAPRFEAGKLTKPGYATVFHNGVLVHHHQEIIGQMAHRIVRAYESHDAEEPFSLQDHDTPVRYRNIWMRRGRNYDGK